VKGRRIAVLESRLGRQLVELVEARGAAAFHAPALAEIPDLDPRAIASLIELLRNENPKLAIFQTGVGTRALFAATDALGLTPELKAILSRAVVAVRGPKPTGALRGFGVRIDRSAAEPFTTREILRSISDVPLRGERVLVQRHGVANRELDEALEAKGARVSEVPLYRWSLPADTKPLEELVAKLGRGEIDAVAFTNAEQARNLFAVSEKMKSSDATRNALNGILVASIGPVASAALREAGVKVGVEAHPPKLGALLNALESTLK
jgi:uroporphyrinogen-III synthase